MQLPKGFYNAKMSSFYPGKNLSDSSNDDENKNENDNMKSDKTDETETEKESEEENIVATEAITTTMHHHRLVTFDEERGL